VRGCGSVKRRWRTHGCGCPSGEGGFSSGGSVAAGDELRMIPAMGL
jgi:hypothetical protein